MSATNNTLVAADRDYVMELTTCQFDDDEQIRYTTYGICVKGRSGEILLEHKDISTNRADVEQFIQTCIDGEVSSVHIQDVLEDYMD